MCTDVQPHATIIGGGGEGGGRGGGEGGEGGGGGGGGEGGVTVLRQTNGSCKGRKGKLPACVLIDNSVWGACSLDCEIVTLSELDMQRSGSTSQR